MLEPLPDNLRAEFPVRDHCVFMNHAAVCPIPARTAAAVSRTAQEQRDLGCTEYEPWIKRLEQARGDLAALMGAPPGQVAFVKNTTSGLLLAANGIPWRRGDNIVTTSVEFPANVYPWLALAPQGVETRMADPVDGRIRVDDLVAAMDARTRALAISWVQYTNGFRVDLETLGQVCHDHEKWRKRD